MLKSINLFFKHLTLNRTIILKVVHKWTPNHRDPKLRSHVDKTILLVQIDDKFVPIAENCVQDLGDEV